MLDPMPAELVKRVRAGILTIKPAEFLVLRGLLCGLAEKEIVPQEAWRTEQLRCTP